MRSLEELKELSKPALEYEELIEIARTASSNTEAKNRALEFTKEQGLGEQVAMACRWLRMFRVRVSEKDFESFTSQREEKMTTEEKVTVTMKSSVHDRAFALAELERKRYEELKKKEPQNREEIIRNRKEIECVEERMWYYYRVRRVFREFFFVSELERIFGTKVKSHNYYPSSGDPASYHSYYSSIWHPDEAYTITVDILGGLGYFKLTILPWRLAAFIEFYDGDGLRRTSIWIAEVNDIRTEIFCSTPAKPFSNVKFIKRNGEEITLRSCGIHEWSLMDRGHIVKATEVPFYEMNRNPQMVSYVGSGFLCSCKNDVFDRMIAEE